MFAVYIDTNVLKFSATQLPRFLPREATLNWGGRLQRLVVHDQVTINPNDRISNPELKREAELLPKIADLAKRQVIGCYMNFETLLESWTIRNMDSKTGCFYDAPIQKVSAPVEYERITFGGSKKGIDGQYNFFCSLTEPRFLEWQKATGAYQGKKPRHRQQLADAFHLWCAEHNNCDFFLTLDFKLINVLKRSRLHSSVKAIEPSELLAELRWKTAYVD